MAPGYRASGQSRRTHRGQVDHDVFEGLPVRNWRRGISTIAPPAAPEIASQKNKWDVELPWGMPKDSHLLPQHSQDLLRAARSGKLYQKRPSPEDEEVDPDAQAGEKPEKKDDDTKDKGYVVKTWKQVPKNLEGPEIEYLAKRRKGLRGAAIPAISGNVPVVTKATVRKTDAEGNSYVEEILVAEGQAVEGEVISTTLVADPAALPIEPPKRRIIIKRKIKGPGRGRKKKPIVAPTAVPGTDAIKVEGEVQGLGAGAPVAGQDNPTSAVNTMEAHAGSTEAQDQSRLGEANAEDGDEDGDDGEEDDSGEEGDEGDEQDEEDDQDAEIGDESTVLEPTTSDALFDGPPQHIPSSTLPAPSQRDEPDRGSPLKQATSAAEAHTLPHASHDDEAEAEGDDEVIDDDHAQTSAQSAGVPEIPSNYFASDISTNQHQQGATDIAMDESYNDDQEMLDNYDGNDDRLVEASGVNNAFGTQHGVGMEEAQQHFGFQGHHPNNQDEDAFEPQRLEYQGDSANVDYAENPVSGDRPEAHISAAHDVLEHAPPQSGNEIEGQDSFEDLLGNEGLELPDADEDEDGGDLMAGLDKHLLESSAVASEEKPDAEQADDQQPIAPETIEPTSAVVGEAATSLPSTDSAVATENAQSPRSSEAVESASVPDAAIDSIQTPGNTQPAVADPVSPQPDTQPAEKKDEMSGTGDAALAESKADTMPETSPDMAAASSKEQMEEDEKKAIEEMGGVPLND